MGRSGFYDTYSMRDFFVADNSLGTFVSSATFFATWFSAASFLGLGSSLYIYGVSAILYSIVPWFIGAIFLYKLVDYIKKYDILTFPEFFYIRYGSKRLQFATAFLMIVAYVLYITMQIKGFGLVMKMLLNIPYNVAIFFIYLYILYTTFGGLYSVVRTDIVNAVFIVCASIIFGFYTLKKGNGMINIINNARLINSVAVLGYPIKTPKGGLLHPFCKGLWPASSLISSLFGWGLGLAANPQYVIRIISAKNKSTAKKMITTSTLILLMVYLFIILGSIGLRTIVPTAPYLNNLDEIIPFLFFKIVKNPIGGILLIGIIAASISTANSELLLIANSLVYDLYPGIFPEKIVDDERMLTLNRVAIGLAGTLSLILSFKPPETLIEFGGNIWGVFASTTFLPLYLGSNKNVSVKSIETAFWVGFFAYIIFLFLSHFSGIPLLENLHPGFFAFNLSGISFVITDRRQKHEKS